MFSLKRDYSYDAFGVEIGKDDNDTNPWRYCGEYWDEETGTIYLRARYYEPRTGRFSSEDTHWNIKNMIYGDEPIQKAPKILSIMQSLNLYVYCIGNPIYYIDPKGKDAGEVVQWGFEIAGIITMLDSPLPGPADIAGLIIAGGTLIIAGGMMIYDNITTVDIAAVDIADARDNNNEPTYIYRLGSGNGTNLTPRERDEGLSYSLVKPVSGPYTVTTMEAINSSGSLIAYNDNGVHVSVIPINYNKMQEWKDTRDNANVKPHEYTTLLQSISIKKK